MSAWAKLAPPSNTPSADVNQSDAARKLAKELQDFCKENAAPYKYPRKGGVCDGGVYRGLQDDQWEDKEGGVEEVGEGEGSEGEGWKTVGRWGRVERGVGERGKGLFTPRDEMARGRLVQLQQRWMWSERSGRGILIFGHLNKMRPILLLCFAVYTDRVNCSKDIYVLS